MYLIYVDESGDVGLKSSPTRYFALSGLVIHELRWNSIMESIIKFRKYLRDRYGLKLRDEIHSADFIHHPGDLQRIPKSIRLKILKEVLEFESSLSDINIINVVIDKFGKPDNFDVFEKAWMTLIQRFHNTLSRRNFPGPQNAQDFGMLIVDKTDEKKLRHLSRKMKKYNPVPYQYSKGYRHVPITTIIEDAVHRDSLHSYLIQLSDVNAYFLFQTLTPCKYIRKKGGKNYFDKLDPVLCKVASANNPKGIVLR